LACFRCSLCNKTLGAEYYLDEGLLCAGCKDSKRSQQKTEAATRSCKQCNKPLNNEKVVKEDDEFFHQNCFSKYLRTKMK
jgi:hypothetical protein